MSTDNNKARGNAAWKAVLYAAAFAIVLFSIVMWLIFFR